MMNVGSHTCVAEAPSNIAFLKYWGKSDTALQWPANDSLSMTLKHALTRTEVSQLKDSPSLSVMQDEILLDGQLLEPADTAHSKLFTHLKKLKQLCHSTEMCLRIVTHNSFPKGCGIASSASGYAAMTIGVIAFLLKAESFFDLESKGFDRARLADLARQGSGSAGRSLFGGFVEWVRSEDAHSQSVRPLFETKEHLLQLSDLIVIISGREKKVSSSNAHQAAPLSPLFAVRVAGITEKKLKMINAIRQHDVEELGFLIEQEALEMHAVALTGMPSIQYWTKETEDFICWIREKRHLGDFPAWFTIDAGANVHVICESREADEIYQKIHDRFPQYEVIKDELGTGPQFFWKGS